MLEKNLLNKCYKALFVIIGFLTLISCESSINISELNKVQVNWADLPQQVQNAFINSENDPYLNLDSVLYVVSYNNTSKEGLYGGKREFFLNDDKCYYLKWNNNKEVGPFIFWDGKIIYIYSPDGGGPMSKNEYTLSLYKFDIIKLR